MTKYKIDGTYSYCSIPNNSNYNEKHCDQIAKLEVQFVAIFHNVNLPNSKKIAKVGSTFCQILNKPLRKWQIRLKFLPKWRNFAKSGHTGRFLHCPNIFPHSLVLKR